MDAKDAPQIIEHISHSCTFTPFETKWIPCSARFVLLGQSPKAKGIFQIFQLDKGKLTKIHEVLDYQFGIKCATFGASSVEQRHLAIGDHEGNLNIFDLETGKAFFTVKKAHDKIINSIDGIGGKGPQYGAPEIVTGSRDGCVRVWDPRQSTPVVSLEPADKDEIFPDCWAVGFGNSYNTEERMIVAGYDNGDVKLFDLRQNMLKWDTNVKNGVCNVEFDRKDTMMNKLVVTTLESKFIVFDMKTCHPESGYAGLVEMAHKSTIWGARHLPQNRDIFLTQGGNGTANIYKYNYPAKRVIEDEMQHKKGVVGSLTLLNDKNLSTQPIASFDWSPDKTGLGVMACLDQTCKVIIVTKLNLY